MRRIALLEAITFLMLLLVVGWLGYQEHETRRTQQQLARLARDGAQAHDALCTLKADLARRIHDGHEFVRTHPAGIAGISRADIEKSIANQQATLTALSTLACPSAGAG